MHPALNPNVHMIQVREDGLVGSLYLPGTSPPWPAVIVVGGSSPGIFGVLGLMLASEGFAALALGYFGMPGLPPTFERIPLEYFGAALRWLARRNDIRPDAIAVAGASRGGELALLLAATYPEIRAAISWVGSGLVYGGVVSMGAAPVAGWTRDGVDLPFAGFVPSAVKMDAPPVSLTPGFLAALDDTAAVAAAEIPVERINGPVLLISGTDDAVWPATTLSEFAERRLRAHGHPHAVEHLVYEGAGHIIGPPVPGMTFNITHAVHPIIGLDFAFGGTPEKNTAASVDSWPRIIAFLNQALAARV
ncbi:MAG TPA: acyl-CoA thioester hydrolase/BAAT C-terminal domain-containing protein [Vicinamibacterales bacterium]|nr:acyl-CoA thioester hydrolase/BAAT C-terminal domain-containing protein [Vicinamibacterales bacterium]